MDLETARAIVARWRPELTTQSARLHTDGWNVWALEVGDWVVRIPRRPSIVDEMLLEMRLVDAIRPLLPVAVPRSQPVGVLDDGTPFFAHPRIPGEPIDAATARSSLVASALVGLLHALDDVPVRQVTQVGAPVEDADAARARLAATAERVTTEVLPRLPAEAADRAASDWAAILAAAAGWQFDLAVVHADLYAANILVDRARRVLTGVIDWTSLRVGDRAADFAGLLADLGSAVATDLAELYADDAGQARELLDRAATYARAEPYAEVLFGLDFTSAEHVDRGLAQLAAPQ